MSTNPVNAWATHIPLLAAVATHARRGIVECGGGHYSTPLLRTMAGLAGVPFVTQQLASTRGQVVAATDYIKNYAEQIRAFVPADRSYRVLGTDGFGRSDFRSKLRQHFEVNRHYIVVAALKALADRGDVPATRVAEAIKLYPIDTERVNPLFA